MTIRFGGRGGIPAAAAGAIATVAVACSGGGDATVTSPDIAPGRAAPVPVTVPSPPPPATAEPTASPVAIEVSPAATGMPTARTPIPPRRGRTATPTPVYRAPETRTGDATGLSTTPDNIAGLYDPFQPEGDREIGYGQYRPAVPRDSITPVYVPRIRKPAELQIQIAPDELVLGVEVNGESRAYPIGLMRFREMANDTLGGVPILVTW